MRLPQGHRWFPTIRSRLLAALAGCVLLPLLAGQLWMQLGTRASLIESELEKYKSLTSQAARQVAAQMHFYEGNLRTLSKNAILKDKNTVEELNAAISNIYEAGSFWTDISLYDEEGDLVTTSAKAYTEPRELTAWFARALKGEIVIAPPQRVMRHDSLDVAVYVPITEKTSNRTLVVRGLVPFDEVRESLNQVHLGSDGEIALLDGRGNALHHKDGTRVLTRLDGVYREAFKSQADHGLSRDSHGAEVYWIAQRLTDQQTRVTEPWTLVAIVPRRHVTALADQGSVIMLGAGLATLLLVAGLGFAFSDRIAQPIVHAAEAAHHLALGDNHACIQDNRGPRELRQLAQAFNAMVAEVTHHRTDLQKLVELRTRSLQEQQARSNHLSAQLRAAFEATEEAILILRSDGVVLGANRRFGRFFGARVDTLGGSRFEDWQHDFFGCFSEPGPIAERWAQSDTLAPRSQPALKWQVVRPERRVLDVYASPLTSDTGEILGRLWVFRDLTHEQQLQDSLEQAQKMEAIGRLAGGIAHDFNNLLTGIIGNLSLADSHLSSLGTEEPRRHVHYAHSAAERAAQLVKGLLGFSRRSHLELTHCDLNAALREFAPLLQPSLGVQFPVTLDPQDPLWGVQADVGKLEQVVMNLCVNARDAMQSAGSHGTITIRTRNETVADDVAQRHHSAPGEYVCLSVTDTGCGIPPEVIDKIFEPFFTTKEQGKGTGLGLATSYGIVQQHGGWMECLSTPGQGTTFNVYLPRNEVPASAQITPTTTEPTNLRGDETILLVDDEIMVRLVAETLLKSHGYSVITASDGAEAVRLFQNHQHEISLVLMDMTMPRMSGREAFQEIRALDRLTPVVICSGYVVDLGDWLTPQGDRPNGFVQKPYNLRDLVSSVRQLIDASTQQPSRHSQRPARSAILSI